MVVDQDKYLIFLNYFHNYHVPVVQMLLFGCVGFFGFFFFFLGGGGVLCCCLLGFLVF